MIGIILHHFSSSSTDSRFTHATRCPSLPQKLHSYYSWAILFTGNPTPPRMTFWSSNKYSSWISPLWESPVDVLSLAQHMPSAPWTAFLFCSISVLLSLSTGSLAFFLAQEQSLATQGAVHVSDLQVSCEAFLADLVAAGKYNWLHYVLKTYRTRRRAWRTHCNKKSVEEVTTWVVVY